MTPWLSDPDVDIYVGDALDVLRGLPDASVDCCVTSPPYWGLRDYGTGEWDGGNPDCDHEPDADWIHRRYLQSSGLAGNGPSKTQTDAARVQWRNVHGDTCPQCGAHRQDRQLGLEATPDLYVAAMVAVFREVRRVLADHGTCWVNLGDSYASNRGEGSPDTMNPNAGATRAFVRSAEIKGKDLVGIPWTVAFALRADGWWLRSDIVWAKPNPMPESVTDRPTKAHEYVFLLTKRPRYWFDAEAVREPYTPDDRQVTTVQSGNGAIGLKGINERERWAHSGRNVRSVWEIATQPYPEAHFATFPEELARRCILAGCPERVCRVCGKASERIVEETAEYAAWKQRESGWAKRSGDLEQGRGTAGSGTNSATVPPKATTVGWSDCGHNAYRPGTVLDPFLGSGTTAHVARKNGRRSIGIELNAEYARLAARRLQQLSLLADGAA